MTPASRVAASSQEKGAEQLPLCDFIQQIFVITYNHLFNEE